MIRCNFVCGSASRDILGRRHLVYLTRVAEKVAPMAGGVLMVADGGVVSKLGTKGDPDLDISPVDVDSNTCE